MHYNIKVAEGGSIHYQCIPRILALFILCSFQGQAQDPIHLYYLSSSGGHITEIEGEYQYVDKSMEDAFMDQLCRSSEFQSSHGKNMAFVVNGRSSNFNVFNEGICTSSSKFKNMARMLTMSDPSTLEPFVYKRDLWGQHIGQGLIDALSSSAIEVSKHQSIVWHIFPGALMVDSEGSFPWVSKSLLFFTKLLYPASDVNIQWHFWPSRNLKKWQRKHFQNLNQKLDFLTRHGFPIEFNERFEGSTYVQDHVEKAYFFEAASEGLEMMISNAYFDADKINFEKIGKLGPFLDRTSSSLLDDPFSGMLFLTTHGSSDVNSTMAKMLKLVFDEQSQQNIDNYIAYKKENISSRYTMACTDLNLNMKTDAFGVEASLYCVDRFKTQGQRMSHILKFDFGIRFDSDLDLRNFDGFSFRREAIEPMSLMDLSFKKHDLIQQINQSNERPRRKTKKPSVKSKPVSTDTLQNIEDTWESITYENHDLKEIDAWTLVYPSAYGNKTRSKQKNFANRWWSSSENDSRVCRGDFIRYYKNRGSELNIITEYMNHGMFIQHGEMGCIYVFEHDPDMLDSLKNTFGSGAIGHIAIDGEAAYGILSLYRP